MMETDEVMVLTDGGRVFWAEPQGLGGWSVTLPPGASVTREFHVFLWRAGTLRYQQTFGPYTMTPGDTLTVKYETS